MNGHNRAHLISALVATVALTSQPAGATPSTADPTAAPVRAPAIADARRPLIAAVPPANDELANAEVAWSLPFTATTSTLEATTAPDDLTCGGNIASVWFAYTPPISTTLAADTFGSDYDTTLSAYTGAPGSLTQLACNDDAGSGLQSHIVVPVAAGQTYYFMAAGLSGGGSLTFHLDGSAFPQIGVRTTPAQEVTPAADAERLAWSQASRRNPGWTLYVQRFGEPRVRVNRQRTNGFSGGFVGETLVYQEAQGRQSDLVLFDLAGGGRSAPPIGVNTRQWEWHPTIFWRMAPLRTAEH